MVPVPLVDATLAAYRVAMPVILIEHAASHTSGLLLRSLVDHGLRVETVRVAEDEPLPADLAELDGVVSLGGPQSATDDSLTWIDGEMTLLRSAAENNVPTLGIGFGANLLARALGGSIETQTSSPGFHRVDLNPVGREDPLFRGLPWFGSWPRWSRDRVTELPTGARTLAGSDSGEIDGFACGIFTFGIGFEPDWTASTLVDRLEDASDPLSAAVPNRDALAATVKDCAESVERQARRFAENVASYLMPIERVNAGVAKDIHH